RPQADHPRAPSQAGKSVFADWSVDDPPRAKALKQTVADLVGALVFRDFLAHQKNIGITLQFFCERLIERLTICDFSHGEFVFGDGAPSRRSCAGSAGGEPPGSIAPLA